MESQNKDEEKNITKKLDLDVNLQIESANGFLVIKGYENIILIQDKEKSKVLKREDQDKLESSEKEEIYNKYFVKSTDNLENLKLCARTNEKKNLFPLTVSSMRYSLAAILADISKKTGENFTEFNEIFKRVRDKLHAKNLSFDEFFFQDSTNELITPNNQNTNEKSISFEKKYMIHIAEFKEKLSDLIIEINSYSHSSGLVEFPNLPKLIEMLINLKEKKINLLNFYHLVYNTPKKFNYTNLILFGEFAERCLQEFRNTDKENLKDLLEEHEKIYNNKNFYELPIKTLPIIACKLGDNHILLLTIDKELYSFGDGSKGATGNGLRTFHIIPTKIKFFQREKKISAYKEIKIDKIACGSRHCLALTTSKIVYSWGFGKNGRLGHGDDKDVFEPRMIEEFEITKIEFIEAADNYSAAISCVNSLFTWGCGEFNRLGHEGTNDVLRPKKVTEFSSDIENVKCGYYCMLVLKKNELFSVGAKTLFAKSFATEYGKNEIPYFKKAIQDKKIFKIIYSFEKQKRKLIAFSSGFSFISLVTQDIDEKETNHNNNEKNKMKLFIWGNVPIDDLYSNKNTGFVLINDDTSDFNDNEASATKRNKSEFASNKKLPTINQNEILNKKAKNVVEKENISKYLLDYQRNKTFKNSTEFNVDSEIKKIQFVTCSDNNTVILASDGSMYAFGSAEYKIAKINIEEFTLPIQPKLKASSVALGKEHIIVVTKSFETYGWGRNNEGQLGLGEGSSGIKEEPCLIEKLRNFGCLHAYSKENFSIVYDNNKRIHIFGDLGFLENDSSTAKKFLPKTMLEWGEIEYFACGPSHFVFIVQDTNGHLQIKSVGNGMYGKLGYDPERDDNKYEPVNVKNENDILKNLTLNNLHESIKIVCSRKQTILMRTFIEDNKKDKSTLTETKLYVWGYCNKLFFNQDQLNKLKNASKLTKYDNNNVSVNIPTEPINSKLKNLIDIQLTDSIFFFINSDNDLEFYGDLNKKYENFKENKLTKENFANKNFQKIFVGRDHAIALDVQGKLFGWGNNNYKKLGLPQDIKDINFIFNENKDEDFIKVQNLFFSKPQELKEINKIFQNQIRMNTSTLNPNSNPTSDKNIEEKAKTEFEGNNGGEAPLDIEANLPKNLNNVNKKLNNNTNNNKENSANEKKIKGEIEDDNKEEINLNDGLISQIQIIVKNEFDELEENLLNKEVQLKEKMQEILAKCKFLKENEIEAKTLKRMLFNNFTFKMQDPPLNISIKTSMRNNKYPEEYSKFKKNYKAFLSTLFNHPCYLKNIYEHIIINDEEKEKRFYKIIKQLYSNMYQHEYKLFSFINLLKNLFDVYLTKKTNPQEQGNNNNNTNKKDFLQINFFSFDLFRLNIRINFDFIFKMIGYFFRQNIEFIKNQERFAASVIASIFKKFGSFVSRTDYNTLFDFTKNVTKQNIYEYYTSIINSFFESMSKCQDLDTLFNNTGFSSNQNFFEFPENISIFLTELADVVKKHYEYADTQTIFQWIYKNIAYIMFKRFFKIIKDPSNQFAINSSIIVDKKNLQSFFKGSFFCIEWALKFSLLYVIFKDEKNKNFEVDDISKKLKNKLLDKLSEHSAKYKEIFNKNPPNISLFGKFDLKTLEEFFNYSFQDNNHYINFSLDNLKFLQKHIISNIEKIRVLNKDFDLMDIIFFNKNREFYIGEDKGVAELFFNSDEDINIQVNLKSRILSNEIQSNLMRCKNCKTICAKEFILANDEIFFAEIDFFENSSKEGRLKKVLKTCEKINNKDILEFLKEQKSNSSKGNELKDNLYNLFNLFAVEKKKDLYIDESDILNSEKLMEIMLSEKSIGKELEDLSKKIFEKYEKMKNHYDYYCNIERKLRELDAKIAYLNEQKINKQNIKSSQEVFKSRKEIFQKAKENLERGYANKEVLENGHLLVSSCKLLDLKSINQKNDNSKGLSDKLAPEKLNKMSLYKEFTLKYLIDNKVILSILHNDLKDIGFNEYENYKIEIQKNRNNEFIFTISKITKPKNKGFFVCGKTGNNNVKNIANKTLTNETINEITNESLKDKPNPYIIDDFLKFNPKELIKILKKMNFSTD